MLGPQQIKKEPYNPADWSLNDRQKQFIDYMMSCYKQVPGMNAIFTNTTGEFIVEHCLAIYEHYTKNGLKGVNSLTMIEELYYFVGKSSFIPDEMIHLSEDMDRKLHGFFKVKKEVPVHG